MPQPPSGALWQSTEKRGLVASGTCDMPTLGCLLFSWWPLLLSSGQGAEVRLFHSIEVTNLCHRTQRSGPWGGYCSGHPGTRPGKHS